MRYGLVAFAGLMIAACGGDPTGSARQNPPEDPNYPHVPIIPGLAGFGVETPAGRRGKVIRVTNLNNSGTGSLRAALSASGPRTIVFEVGGTIMLSSNLSVSEPYVTVAGQTAPAPGLTLRGGTLVIRAHDVLVQHIRVRPGDGTRGTDAVQILGPAYNVVIDHVSASWGTDENISTSGSNPHDITIANTISSEGLGTGGLLVFDGSKRIAIVGTLFAHNGDRNPYFKGNTSGVFVNNVVYDWGDGVAYTGDPEGSGPSEISFVGNAFLYGPSTVPARPMRAYATTSGSTRFYVSDNTLNAEGLPADPWSLVTNDRGASIVAETPPVWPDGLTPMPAEEVVAAVLASAGAWPAFRDPVDARLIEEVRRHRGAIIGSQSEVGGWPNLGTPRRALTLPTDPNGDADRDGYTNLEEWLHALAAVAEGR